MPKPDLSYQDWIDYVFDHAVPFYEQAWYFESDADWWTPQPAQAIEYLTRLFEHPEPLVDQFADSQIRQGLNYLVSSSAGDYCRFLLDTTAPIETRLECIRAMPAVFARLFQPRCTPTLSHLDEPGANALNGICYMWWDVIPLYGIYADERNDPKPNPIDDACLAVMRETLRLPNPACQESALHGLGHWAGAYPEFTAATINAYLAANPTLRPELVRYAQAARGGCVQ